jgi:hypothetical protein
MVLHILVATLLIVQIGRNNMNPWEMVWNVITGKEEQVKPVEQPKADYLDRLSMAESSGRADVKSTTSSAVGQHQFLKRTWEETVAKMGKNYTLEDRKNPEKSKEVAAYFTEQNKKILKNQLGKDPSDTQLYAAHFLGASGAKKFLTAAPFELATKVVDKDQVEANPNIFYTKDKKPRTVGEVYSILKNKIQE